MATEYISLITCPVCNESFSETMPEDSCQFFWECPACGEVSKPAPGDCCVYCSFGNNACPPVQQQGHC